MFQRLLLLVLVLAVPVLTALGTQQLAATTEPPALPATPVQPQILSDPSVPPGSQGGPARTAQRSDTDLTAGQLTRSHPEDAGPVQDPAGESDLDGQQDDAQESGSAQR